MGRRRIVDNYSDKELVHRLGKAESFQGFIEGLGYTTGRSQNTRNVVINRLEEAGIDYKTLLKESDNLVSNLNKIPDKEYYVKGNIFRGNNLARRLKKDNIIGYKCSWCGLGNSWNNKELVLHLDHIDGDSYNNEIENLRWLCPNCHSQTRTYTGRNKKGVISKLEVIIGPSQRVSEIKRYDVSTCMNCNIKFNKSSNGANKYCTQECYRLSTRKVNNRPTKEELYRLLSNNTFTSVGEMYGVTGNSIRKWCKDYEIPSKAKYYRKYK